MSEVSIICLRKDLDPALEVLDDFGNLHIEEAKQSSRLIQYQQLIRQTEGIIGKLSTIIDQLEIEKTGFLDIFRAKKPSRTQISTENWQSLIKKVEKESSQLKMKVDNLANSTKTVDERLSTLQHLQRVLRLLDRFKINPKALDEMHFIYVIVATVPSRNLYQLEKALSNHSGIFHHRPLTKEMEFVFLATPSKYKDDTEKILKTHHAERIRIPEEMPTELSIALENVNDQLKKTLENKKTILESLENIAEADGHRLLVLRETAQNILKVLDAKQKSSETERLVTVEGFVPKKEVNELQKEMGNRLNGRVLVLEEGCEAAEDPPTSMHNPSFIKPFETITRLYGLPHYDELDPTPLIAITFPLIFGLMFGDIGHGLILLIGGSMLGMLIKTHGGLSDFSWMIAECGVGAVFAGLLFGEFFGRQMLTPLWFDPFEELTGFLLFSLFVGIIQIMIGFVLDFINFILKGDRIDAFATAVPKMLFYLGAVYLILSCQLDFNLWLKGPILFPLVPFIFLIFGKRIIVKTLNFLGHPVRSSSAHISLVQRFFESGDLVTRLLSNTMSYARILALLMAHWALLLVTYTISDMVFQTPVFGAALSILVIVGGNIFVMAFEGLIVFIHTLRLHFYEWFSKFYEGTGVEFSPFRQSCVYSKILFTR